MAHQDICMFAGKGGVGKTVSAVSTALAFAQFSKTAILDNDGGHSVATTLRLKDPLHPNVLTHVGDKLFAAIVEPTSFVGITEAIELGWSLQRYFEQFPKDLGLIPYADMANAFFGMPTDIGTLQRFLSLTMLLHSIQQHDFGHVVIDIEPTAGLERLLSNASSTARSLRNLAKQGVVTLTVLGAKWPHIAEYLRGEYIKNAETYAARLEHITHLLVHAKYMVVCTPERIPVQQAFAVADVIRKYGGRIQGYVVNNMTGADHELANIQELQRGARNRPIVRIARNARLQTDEDLRPILREIGEKIRPTLR